MSNARALQTIVQLHASDFSLFAKKKKIYTVLPANKKMLR